MSSQTSLIAHLSRSDPARRYCICALLQLLNNGTCKFTHGKVAVPTALWALLSVPSMASGHQLWLCPLPIIPVVVVMFERNHNDDERLFIGWRRHAAHDRSGQVGGAVVLASGGGNWTPDVLLCDYHHPHTTVPYPPDCLQLYQMSIFGVSSIQMCIVILGYYGRISGPKPNGVVFQPKLMRHFRVNLECLHLDGGKGFGGNSLIPRY